MKLVDEIEINNFSIKFYFGMNIDIILKHPNDGSSGFIYCFIESFKEEMIRFKREIKIDDLFENKRVNIDNLSNFDINNSYVCIYQTGELQNETFKIVKEILLNNKGNASRNLTKLSL